MQRALATGCLPPEELNKLMEWKAESLVLTTFVPSVQGTDALTPFRDIITGVPNQLNVVEGNPKGQRASTDFGAYTLSVVARPGRIDLLVEPKEGDPPVINDPEATLGELAGFSDRLLSFAPTVRLAVVANLQLFVASADQAVAKFAELAGINPPAPNATDLIFQKNEPLPLTGQLNLNRVERWGTSQIQILEFKMSVGPGASGGQPMISRQWHAVSHTFDYNTALSPVILSTDDAHTYMARLLDEVRAAIRETQAQVDE